MVHRISLNSLVRVFFYSIFIFIVMGGFYIFSEEKKFKEGAILYEDTISVKGEYLDLGDGNVFIRDSNIGFPAPKDKILEIVDYEFYSSIKSNSKWKSSLESFYLFHAGSHHQWKYNEKGSYFFSDSFIRPLKIGLLLLTGYTYSSAVQANRRLGNSIYGLNASGRQEAFQRRNQEFVVSSMLTSTVFLGSSIVAYIRFGRDSDWNDLRIPGRTEITIDELQQRVLNNSSRRRIELSYEKRF